MTRKIVSLLLCLAMLLSAAMFAGAEANTGRLVDEDAVVTILVSEHPHQQFPQNSQAAQWIYERTGIKLDVMPIPAGDYETKYPLMIAGGTMPDILMNISLDNYKLYTPSGAFAAVSDYFDTELTNVAAVLQEASWVSSLYIDGKLYCIPTMAFYTSTLMGQEPMIRGDALEAVGIDMPTTFDELYDVLIAFKEEYPNSYPWCIRGGTGYLLNLCAYMMGTGPEYYYDQDLGCWCYSYISEKMIDELEFISSLYQAGVIDPDYATCDSATWQEKCSNGTCLFTFDNPTFNLNFDTAVREADENAYWTYVPVLENWYGQRRGLRYSEEADTFDVISAKSENLDVCLKLYNFLYSEEGRILTNYGVENETYIVGEDGQLRFTDEVIERAMTYSDPWRGILGEYGMGALGLGRWNDDSNQNVFISDVAREWYDYWGSEEALHERKIIPTFTNEESERITELSTAVSTYLTSVWDKYIIGEIPAADFVDVQAKLIELGAHEVVDIYNAAQARMDALMG